MSYLKVLKVIPNCVVTQFTRVRIFWLFFKSFGLHNAKKITTSMVLILNGNS